MKETTNLKLKKYDYTDNVDMSTGHNLNMDTVDTEIQALKTGKASTSHSHISTDVNYANNSQSTVSGALDKLFTDNAVNKTDISSLKTKTDTTNTNLNNLTNTVNAGQKHKLTQDSGIAQLPTNKDVNTWVKCGTYMGSSLTNAPNTTDWYFVEVKSHNDLYIVQTATNFTNYPMPKFERCCINGVWQPWRSL